MIQGYMQEIEYCQDEKMCFYNQYGPSGGPAAGEAMCRRCLLETTGESGCLGLRAWLEAVMMAEVAAMVLLGLRDH